MLVPFTRLTTNVKKTSLNLSIRLLKEVVILRVRLVSGLRPWQTRTHCGGHIVAHTNVSPFARTRNICCGRKVCVRNTKNVFDFVQKHFVSATNVSQFA